MAFVPVGDLRFAPRPPWIPRLRVCGVGFGQSTDCLVACRRRYFIGLCVGFEVLCKACNQMVCQMLQVAEPLYQIVLIIIIDWNDGKPVQRSALPHIAVTFPHPLGCDPKLPKSTMHKQARPCIRNCQESSTSTA